ncbi:MAG: hypothetical protein M1816_006874 [Peltula sp. TS41687]|nr:MAG: hypothetical protein M1816_006874 [Peltula sp. TS41687]
MRTLQLHPLKRARIPILPSNAIPRTTHPIPNQRRFDSSSSSSSSHSPAPKHAEPVNEHFGKWFFITLTLIPVSFAVYKYANSGVDHDATTGLAQPALVTRLIDRYSDYKERWAERNHRHTRMVEQAAFDRHLFHSSPGSKTVELRFPEIFNTGSPWNVVAGQGGGSLDRLVEKYEREHREMEEKKVRNLRARRRREEEEGRKVEVAKGEARRAMDRERER